MASVDTGLHADVVAFCPWANALDVLACATYELRDGARVGRLQLFSVHGGVAAVSDRATQAEFTPACAPELALRAEAQLDCAGIFDAAWLPPPSQPSADGCLLALACADGSVQCVHTGRQVAGGPVSVETVARCELQETKGAAPFCLAVDWAWSRDTTVGAEDAAVFSSSSSFAQKRLACCDSAGRAHIFGLDGAAPQLISSWQAHALEVWTVAHQRTEGGLLLTGADDCELRGWDVRALERPAFVNRKGHSMGVTSIQSDPRAEHIVLTGSYDEHLRTFDLRMPQRELCSLALGGGVWCAHWHPRMPGAIVTACMHNGFHLVRACDGHAGLEHAGVCSDRQVGDALAYGADWSHAPPGEGGHLIGATCSFYDHTLELWATRASLFEKAAA